MHKVFVYGSLKSGHWNHRLLSNSEFLGKCKTMPVFTMVDYASFPAVIADGETAIVGELYKVDDFTLNNCDHLEGHPNWYKRIEVETELGKAWMYCMLPEHVRNGANMIPSGEWKGAA